MVKVENNVDELLKSEKYPVDGKISPTFYNVGDTDFTIDNVPVAPGNFIQLKYDIPMAGYVDIVSSNKGTSPRLIVHYGTTLNKTCGCKTPCSK